MKPNLLFLLFTTLMLQLGFQNNVNAQGNSNSIEVTEIVSPVPYYNYKLKDSSDFVIRIRNLGPEALIGGDQFKLSFSIYGEGGTNSISSDTNIYIGTAMPVGGILEYTLMKNVSLGNMNDKYVACAEVKGTQLYPINSNKFPGKCTPFLVSIEHAKLQLNKVYYANGRLFFDLKSTERLTAEVFDIRGKLLKKINLLNADKKSISFNAPANGFYFLKVYNTSGANTTMKFVVNQ